MSERPTALVTGASRGIGAAIAHALAPTHDLLLGGRDAEGLAKVCDGLPGARPWPVELTSVTEADVAGIDRLDVLVHSAGVMALGRIADTPAEVWRRTMETNVVAVAELTRLLPPALRAAHGHVVLINSGSGQRSNPGLGLGSPGGASSCCAPSARRALRAEEPGPPGDHRLPGTDRQTDMQREVRAQEGGAPDQAGEIPGPGSVARARPGGPDGLPGRPRHRDHRPARRAAR